MMRFVVTSFRRVFSRVVSSALVAAFICASLPARADEGRSSYVIASAGYDRHANVGQTIQLDASRSQSSDGRPLSYSWTTVSKPAGSIAALSAANSLRPKFIVDVAGDYVFALKVQIAGDATATPATGQVTVSTSNVAPVADVGPNRRAALGATIAFDGAKSFDADGDAIAYAWTLTKKPLRSTAALKGSTSTRPTLTLDGAGTYVAELVVTDSSGKKSAPSRVAVSTRDAIAGRASAGPAQTLSIGATARIDADGTYLPVAGAPVAANAANAAWALLAKPAGSAATLAVAPDARQALTLDATGDYVVQAMIAGASKCGEGDDFDDRRWPSQRSARLATTLITTGNVPAVADAGQEQRFTPGAVIALDGSKSSDVNGDLLSYNWALIVRPAGSNATLDDSKSARPEFTADVAGTYVAQLVVDDGFGASTPATVVVTSEASRPIVDAGPDPLAKAGAVVTLDGSRSFDLKGDTLTANWAILGLGDQPNVGSLSAPTNPKTNFNVPAAGVPLAQVVFAGPAALAVPSDDHDASGPRGVDLNSVGRLSNNGVPYTIWRIRNVTANGRVATIDSAGTSFSLTLTIPAKSDLFVASPIVDGTATHRLLANGQVYETVDALSTTFADQRLVGGGPALKLSIVELLVANSLLFDSDDAVISTVEARPIAVLSATTPAWRNTVVQLDGSASLNPNKPDAPATGLTYSWSLLSRPAGSKATLKSPPSAMASFSPDAYGRYVAQLIVSDGLLASRPRTIVIEVAPRPPVAAAAAKTSVSIGQNVTLDGTASVDPDGNPLSYAWSLTSVPPGSKATVTNAASATASFTTDVVGTYVASIVVSDAYGVSKPASVSIVAQGGLVFTPPIGPQQVTLGSSLSFIVTAKDPAGKAVGYSFVGSLPQGASFDTTTGAFNFRPATNNPANYSFAFQATNGKDVATLTVPVSVTGAASGATGLVLAQVYDAVDYARGVLTPVANVVVSSSGVSGTSGADGAVSIAGLAAGQDTLVVSAVGAAHAPDGSAYLDTVVSANVIPGVTNTLDAPILLARATGGGTINGGGATTISNSSLGVTLTIAANSAFNADGTPYTGQIAIGSLPTNTPVSLPPGFAPCQLLTISPVGVTFDPPAQLTVANNDRLPPGANVDLWAFDPQLSNSRVVGVGRVSADGATIATFIGGVPGGTILAMAPRRPGLAEVQTQPADVFSPSVLGGGDLATSFSPPGTRQLNAGRGLTFVYHASTANPRPLLDMKAKLGLNVGTPKSLQSRLVVDGVAQASVLSTDLSKPLAGGAALDPGRQNAILQAAIADAGTLSNGAHNYSFLTVAKYACSAVGSVSSGSFAVNNQTKSAFGAGWQLAELQKLDKKPDGTVSITEGNGRVLVEHPQQAPDFLPDPVYVPVNGPYRGAVADMSGDGRPSILRLGWKPTVNRDGSPNQSTLLNVILNKGGRQFVKSSVLAIGRAGTQRPDGSLVPAVYDLAAGDLDGDGAADVGVIADGSAIDLYTGASGGVFLPSPVTVEDHSGGGNIIMADMVGVGTIDPVISEGVNDFPDYHLVFNDGRGRLTFAQNGNRLPGNPLGMAAVRFPGFVHDSFAGVTSDGSLLFTYGGATATEPWSRGVGKVETTFPRYNVDAFLADATYTDRVLVSANIRQGNVGRILAAGDIDGTGYPTFAVAAADGVRIVKWRAPGANNQEIVQTLTLPGGLAPDSVTLAPLAKGNRASLVVTTGGAGFYVFLNDGTGKFGATPTYIATPFRAGIEADVVDFDGDGIADIAVNDLDNDRVAIYFGKPHADGAFVAPIGDYTRLVKNPDGSFSRLYNDGTSVAFDADGFQTSIVDANGNRTLYSYNGQGQLTQIVDPTGAATLFTYSGAFIASATDGAGRTTSFEHDGAGNLTKVTDPLGNVTQYLYDANHQLIATIDPNGGQTQNSFNSAGKLSGQTYPDGSSVKLDVSKALGLDALGVDLGGPANAAFVPEGARITKMQDALGHLSETEVNEWGAVTRVTDALGRVSRFYRDGANRVTHSETPAGTSTGPIDPSPTGLPQIGASDMLANDYAWDERGNLLILHEAAGHPRDPVSYSELDRTTRYVYEASHNKAVQKTDAEGNVTKWSYDANGNMSAMTDALGSVTAYSYNAQGLALTKTDPKGNVTSYAYDASGNITRTTDALGTKFDRYYDTAGNLILSIDAAGTPIERRRSSRYDADNRVVQQTSATGQVTTTGYDANGNVTQTTDPAGNITTRVYDSQNRLASETTPDAGTSSYTYDANGNRLTATDSSGAVTRYAYDEVNRTISVTDALGAERTLAYDLRDDVSSVTNARGKTTTLGYDLFKRLHSRADPAAGEWPYQYLIRYDRDDRPTALSSPTRQTTFLAYDALGRLGYDGRAGYAYDAAGNVTQAYGDFGIGYSYAYDALNRRVTANHDGGFPVRVTFTYAYDALGRRTAMADSLGGTTAYAYDAEDRVTSITTPWGGRITQSYDAAGRPQRLAYPNGLDADLSFETATGRLAGIVHRPGTLGTPIARFDHAYDIRGNLAALNELAGSKSFAYDKVERLTAVTKTSPAPATEVESYAYDPEGNRLVTHISPAYVTDDADRVLDDGDNTYTWSMDGQMTSRMPKNGGVRYDFASSFIGQTNQMRLERITGSDGKEISVYYDPFQRLVAHHWPQPRGFDELYYDGPDVVLELRHLSTGDQWVRYVHGPGADQPLATEVYAPWAAPTPGTGSQFYYHADGEGSIRLLTDAAGQVANRYDYDSFGRRQSVVESVLYQPYGWKGREFVPGPDIYYNRARFYDPLLGRFMSQDPLGYGAGDFNLYSFGWNDPRRWSDFSGRSASLPYAADAAEALKLAGKWATIGCLASLTFFTAAAYINTPDNMEVVSLKAGPVPCSVAPIYLPKPIPLDRALPKPPPCDDEEKKRLAQAYHKYCNQPRACKFNLGRVVNESRLSINYACFHSRADVQNQCFGGDFSDKNSHIPPIKDVAENIADCINILGQPNLLP